MRALPPGARMHAKPMRIESRRVEALLNVSPLHLTATQITKELTGRKLVWQAEDRRVQQHLDRMLKYNVLTITGLNEHGEPYYQLRHKAPQSAIDIPYSLQKVLLAAREPLSRQDISLRIYWNNRLTAEHLQRAVNLHIDKGVKDGWILPVRFVPSDPLKYRLK